ncbi:hypothetical protein L596_016331 [Steinernema carpocapsae]|uniref:Chitin-binding type-1 domain-containing protein n=1 Tax=Steinernema carpocapsae TaxID=34508 RepID=A0A4U5NIN4_STECR|nr:hypothetical protein L596_016331 [Steinernema carpocapsae]
MRPFILFVFIFAIFSTLQASDEVPVESYIRVRRSTPWHAESSVYSGKCGEASPKIDGKVAECNPNDPRKPCCSKEGICGHTDEFCSCKGCVDYRKKLM